MVRFYQLYALILLLAVTASGQVVTSDSGALTNRVWGATVNVPWYLRTIVVQGATPLDLTDRYASFTVRQVDTEALVHSSTGTIHVVNPGEVIFTWTPRAAGTFAAAAKIRRVDTDQIVANIMADTIIVTNPASAGGGGSVSINVVLTNDTDLAKLIAIGQPSGLVVVTRGDGTTDLLPYDAGSSSSGGGPTIYDSASNSFGVATSVQFSSRFAVSGTVDGRVLVDYTTPILPDWSIGTNAVSYGTVGTQLVTFAAGVSNSSVELWGGGACGSTSGGAGTYGKLYLRGDLEAIQLMLYIPQGGEGTTLAFPSTGFVYQTSSAFPGGGKGAGYIAASSFAASPCGSGGYAAAFIISGGTTSLVMIVPGGAGSAVLNNNSVGGDGGNEVAGEDASGVSGGYGGFGATKISNGTYNVSGNLMITGAPPSSFVGGNASLTNFPNTHIAAGGGSPGWYSGSGGFVTTANGRSAGGSAVGWVNRTNSYVLAGDIFGAESGVPVGIDSVGYVAGWAYPSGTPSTYPLTSRAGQGGAVVKW